MKILISAAETSSDAHGAQLLKALRSLMPPGKSVEAFGIGGPLLQAQGLRPIVDSRALLVMGITEVLGRLPRILSALNRISHHAESEKPDIAVVIDYPDFHFRLAKRLKKLGIPVVYYIPPKIWVWRKKRIRVLRDFFARLLVIFPFEEKFYANENVPVKYVGNPLLDELPLGLTKEESRRALNLSSGEPVLVLMPGSRPGEVRMHTELMLDAVERSASNLSIDRLSILMPFPHTADLPSVRRLVETWKSAEPGRNRFSIRVSQGDAHLCLVAADCGLIKSGTSTLEAALLGCPHVIVYKTARLTAWVFKYLVRYKGPVGLVNLAAGWEMGKPYLVKELLLEKANVETGSQSLIQLLSNLEALEAIRSRFSKLRGELQTGLSPSIEAAKEILELCPNS